IAAGPLDTADRHIGRARHAELLGEMIEHHDAAERGGMCRDQEAVVAPGGRSRQRPRRVAAEPISDEPFAIDEPLEIPALDPSNGFAGQDSGHFRFARGDRGFSSPAGSLTNASAASPGILQPSSSVAIFGVPLPPYLGSSVERISLQTARFGGAK